MSITETAIVLENEAGLPVRGDLRVPEGVGSFPVIVIVHGFKGFKDWGMFPPTASRLTERGFATLAINTSMNGVGEKPEEFTELEKFAKNTPRREVKDVRRALDAIGSGELSAPLDAGRIGLLGHSKGGGAVLLTASVDDRVRCLVTWSSIATFYRNTDRALAEWREKGRLEIPNLRTGQILWQDLEVLEDLEASREEYDLEAACRRIRVPLLAVHGANDEAVDAGDAEKIVAWAGSAEKRTEIVPKTGHTFGTAHPWPGPNPAWERAVAVTAEWFERWL